MRGAPPPLSITGTQVRTPLSGRELYPNLQRPPHSPNKGRGRLQVAIRRAFMVGGNELTSTQVYDWAYSRHRSHLSEAVRWSVHRILRQIADQIGHSRGPGRPWLWRLRN